jgi:hypothetical protein
MRQNVLAARERGEKQFGGLCPPEIARVDVASLYTDEEWERLGPGIVASTKRAE